MHATRTDAITRTVKVHPFIRKIFCHLKKGAINVADCFCAPFFYGQSTVSTLYTFMIFPHCYSLPTQDSW